MDIRRRLTEALGEPPLEMTRIADGHTGPVVAATTRAGDVVVKLAEEDCDALVVEARMLAYLAKHTRTPRVIASTPRALVMEKIDGEPGTAGLAAVLAKLHDVTAGAYGFHEDTAIGGLVQRNPWTASWVQFYGEHRLLAMAPAHMRDRIERLVLRLGEMIDEPDQPRLGHGDVWEGNVLVKDGQVQALIDPALAFVDAELDLALVGDVPGYFELRPPRPGRETRKKVYALWPLLVHTRLFGGVWERQLDVALEDLGF